MEYTVEQAVNDSGLTLDEVAERMGTTKQIVRNWMKGNPMRMDTLRKFCRVTGASADVLLGLKEPESPEEADTVFKGNVNIDEDPEKMVKVLRRDAKELSSYRGPNAHMFFHIQRHELQAAEWIEEYVIGGRQYIPPESEG